MLEQHLIKDQFTLGQEVYIDHYENKSCPRSSLTQTAAPCDICRCKAKRLFSLSQQGLIYFVCHKCYKEVCANRGKFTKNIVDLSNLVRNSQHSVKWEVIGTDNKKLTYRVNKRKRQNKKNKGV